MLTLTGISPDEGTNNVNVDTLIEFSIIDDGSGIDISTLIVEIDGFRALEGTTFGTGYNGTYSEVLLDGDDYNVAIDPESDFAVGKVIKVQIQVRDDNGNYFNKTYAFKTVSAKPILTDSSPSSGETVSSPQMIFLQFEDAVNGIKASSINVSLNGLPLVTDGVFQDGFKGSNSKLSVVTDGLSVNIEPQEDLRDGVYELEYSVSDRAGDTLFDRYNFTVSLDEVVLPTVFPQVRFAGYRQGMKKVSDLGTGNGFRFEWNTPKARSYKAEVFILIYENTKRLEIFDSLPSYIATSDISLADVDGFTPGLTMSFAARAVEAFDGTFDLTGMTERATGFYEIPESVEIAQTINESDTKIYVDSVSGYPESGLIRVGNEVIKYTSISEGDTAFLVPSGGRGLNGTTPGVYVAGDSVRMFLECQDRNTVIIMATPTYQDGYGSGRTINNVGLIVTDYSDADKKFFQGFDFCGYHRAEPDRVLTGVDDCGSYLGGEFDGMRGMNIFDRMVNREEVLLDQTGEPVVLLRRKWNGEVCSCKDPRREHPKKRSCPECYGTGYIGGFDQYDNRRRNDTRIMVSFSDTLEDLNLGEHRHLEQEYNPNCWTLPTPMLRDRDIIVRYDYTDDVEYRYEIQNVTREKLFYRHYTKQKFALVRLDKTDVYYTYPVTLPTTLIK